MILLRGEQWERIYDKQTNKIFFLSFLFVFFFSHLEKLLLQKEKLKEKYFFFCCSKTIWKSLFIFSSFFFFFCLFFITVYRKATCLSLKLFYLFFPFLFTLWNKNSIFLCNIIGSVQRIKKTTNQEFMGGENKPGLCIWVWP